MEDLARDLAIAFPFAANWLDHLVMPHPLLLSKVLRLRLH